MSFVVADVLRFFSLSSHIIEVSFVCRGSVASLVYNYLMYIRCFDVLLYRVPICCPIRAEKRREVDYFRETAYSPPPLGLTSTHPSILLNPKIVLHDSEWQTKYTSIRLKLHPTHGRHYHRKSAFCTLAGSCNTDLTWCLNDIPLYDNSNGTQVISAPNST